MCLLQADAAVSRELQQNAGLVGAKPGLSSLGQLYYNLALVASRAGSLAQVRCARLQDLRPTPERATFMRKTQVGAHGRRGPCRRQQRLLCTWQMLRQARACAGQAARAQGPGSGAGDVRPHVLLLDIECLDGNAAGAAALLQRIQAVFLPQQAEPQPAQRSKDLGLQI